MSQQRWGQWHMAPIVAVTLGVWARRGRGSTWCCSPILQTGGPTHGRGPNGHMADLAGQAWKPACQSLGGLCCSVPPAHPGPAPAFPNGWLGGGRKGTHSQNCKGQGAEESRQRSLLMAPRGQSPSLWVCSGHSRSKPCYGSQFHSVHKSKFLKGLPPSPFSPHPLHLHWAPAPPAPLLYLK